MKTILILLDSLNRRYLKAYDPAGRAITPNIDAFAADSVTFDNHFIGSAPCMPARRDIFTGRTQFLERSWGGIEPFDITLPGELRRQGVYTHMTTDHTHYFEIGGENYCYLFNTWEYHRGQEFDPWISRVEQPETDPDSYGKKSPQYLLNRTTFQREADFPTPKTFRSACNWVEHNKGSDDFFLMVEGFDPHEPFDTPQEYLDLYEQEYDGNEFNWSTYAPVTEPPEAVKHLENCYLATLTMADRWLGKFIDTLKRNGMYEDTLIILTTDHGHMLGEHGHTGKNYMHAYNELAHIPLFVRPPDGTHAGMRVDALTQNTDLMPTILQHHGCPVPDRVRGYDLAGFIEGSIPPREQVIYGWFGRCVNVYDGRYTYFRAPKGEDNKPCYQYCGIPSTVWRYFGEEYAEHIEMGRFLSYTRYPVYKIPVMSPHDQSGEIEPVKDSLLFDLETDYAQDCPLEDPVLTERMCKKMAAEMLNSGSPKEQFERLGLDEYL